MAKAGHQAQWRAGAQAGGKRRIEVWLTDDEVAGLDALAAKHALRGRAAAVSWLLVQGMQMQGTRNLPVEISPRYRLRLWRGGAPGDQGDAWAILVAGETVGRVWRRNKRWIAARKGFYAHYYEQRTRARAVEQMLTCEPL